jgi:hypothetical protein
MFCSEHFMSVVEMYTTCFYIDTYMSLTLLVHGFNLVMNTKSIICPEDH